MRRKQTTLFSFHWTKALVRLLRKAAMFLSFLFKSISSYYHISYHVLLLHDHVVLYYKTLHIIHTIYYIQSYTLEVVISSEPIIICCRIATKTSFILFYTWENTVKFKVKNQGNNLVWFPPSPSYFTR